MALVIFIDAQDPPPIRGAIDVGERLAGGVGE